MARSAGAETNVDGTRRHRPRPGSPAHPFLTIAPPSPSAAVPESTLSPFSIKSSTRASQVSGLQITVTQSPTTTREDYGRIGAVSPCFSTISDTRTFYSAVEEAVDTASDTEPDHTVTEDFSADSPVSDSSTIFVFDADRLENPRRLVRRPTNAIMQPAISDESERQDPHSKSRSRRHNEQGTRSKTDSGFSSESAMRPFSASGHRRSSRIHDQLANNRRDSMPTIRPDVTSRRGSVHRLQRPGSVRSQGSYSRRTSSHRGISPNRRQDLLDFHRDSCRLMASMGSGSSFQPSSDKFLSRGSSMDHDLSERPSSESADRQSDVASAARIRQISRATTVPTEMFPVFREAWTARRTNTSQHPENRKFPSTSLHAPSLRSVRASTIEPPSPTSPAVPALIIDHGSDDDSETDSDYIPIPPTTTIDWTNPETRRREYASIDRSTRGLRGLWRRVAPKWCQTKLAGGRSLFYDEATIKAGRDSDDGGSVRRFRVEIANDVEEEVVEHEKRPAFVRKLTGRKQET